MDFPLITLALDTVIAAHLSGVPTNYGAVQLSVETGISVELRVPYTIATVQLSLETGISAVLDSKTTPAGMLTAFRDILRMWRQNCTDDPSDAVRDQAIYVLNAGIQQFFSSQRVHEFITNMRVQEYPPEFTDCIAVGGVIAFRAANAFTNQQPDVIRSGTHKYKCIADHNYDTTTPAYTDPSTQTSLWALINEKDLDLFVKGFPLPAHFYQQAGLTVDRDVQHVSGVVYANQTSSRQNTHILRPVGTTERGGLKLQDLNVRMGVIGDWFDDTQPAVALTTGNYTGSSGSPTLTLVSGGPAAGTIPKGTYVSRTDASFTGIAQGVRVLSHDPVTGVITLDANLTAALTNISLTFTYDRPPLYYEVFRDVRGAGVNYQTTPIVVNGSGTTGLFEITLASLQTIPPGSLVQETSGGTTKLASGTRVIVQNGVTLTIDTACVDDFGPLSLTFRPPVHIAGGRMMLRCFTSLGLDLNSSVFVHWCPTPLKIEWGDVVNNRPFDVALPYLELYLFPIFRFLALQSGYFPPEDYATRAPRIVDRYNEVMGLLGLADFQQPALAKPEPVSTPAK